MLFQPVENEASRRLGVLNDRLEVLEQRLRSRTQELMQDIDNRPRLPWVSSFECTTFRGSVVYKNVVFLKC